MNKKAIILIIILSAVMGGLTLGLMVIQDKQAENNTYIEIDPHDINVIQLDPPKEGDTVAIVDTTIGEFRFVLYTEQSPKAAANFIKFAEEGYYNDTYVFSAESGAYSAMGSKLKNGEMPQGYDVDRELIPRELHKDLWPLRGAVCALNTTVDRTLEQKIFGGGDYYNGSRFAVLNTIEFDEDMKTQMLENSENEELAKAFVEHGGVPNFSQQLTVIGQTYEGLDVVEQLANIETFNTGSSNVPKEDIRINSVTITEYAKK